jgi:hypothetical protein
MSEVMKYNGFTVTLNENFEFVVTGGSDEHRTQRFESMSKAREWIDRQKKMAARAKQIKVKLDVLDPKGNAHVVTGIHRRTGELLGVPDGYYDVYVAHDTIKVLLLEQKQLQDRISEIQTKLRPFQIRTRHRYCSDAETYERRIHELLKEYQTKQAAAIVA